MKRTHKPVNPAFASSKYADLQELVLMVCEATDFSVSDVLRVGARRVIEEYQRTGQVVVKARELRMGDEVPGRRPHPLFG